MTVDELVATTDFGLSFTEQLVRDTARAVLGACSDNAQLRALEAGESGYDSERWGQFVALGWPVLGVREPIGSGGSPIDVGLLLEEVGRAAYPSPLLQASVTAAAVREVAAEPAGDGLFRAIAAGEIAVLVAPLGRGGVVARPSAGGYVLHGEPVVAEWAHVAEHVVVLAPVQGGGWIVAALPATALQGRVRAARTIDNERVGVLDLEEVHIDTAHLVAGELVGGDGVDRALGMVRLLRASEMVGGAQRTLELTAAYMREREQFGVALGSFQAVQHHLADMATHVDAARLTTYEGLSLAALGRPSEAAAAIAGFVAGRAYCQVTVDAAQLHGGIGAAKEHVLHHYFRRAKGMQARLGTVDSQLDAIVAHSVLGESPGPW